MTEPTAGPDWPALRRAAVDAAGSAYAPYSRLQVGAAALVDDGRVVTGCNVENVSYGLGLCAETTLAGQLRPGALRVRRPRLPRRYPARPHPAP